MAKPGDLSSKKIKNSYKAIVQHDGDTSKLYDGTGSMVNSIDVTRITASNASILNITDLNHLTASKVQVDTHLSVSGSTVLGNNCSDDSLTVHGNTWVSGALTVSGSCEGSFRSIGQAKFIYLDNPSIEDQKPATVTRGMVRGQYNVPRFGGQQAALDVYGNAVITGSLIVTDTVFAQEFHSEHVSSSIIYTSGSTKFGGDFSDTMTVTGSIFQSGSDSYFLNGIGLGTTGSQKAGTFSDPGQDNPVKYTHLLRIDDPGHDGLGHKVQKLIYTTWGSVHGAAHVSSSDTIRFRDRHMSEDVFVISSISQSVFLTNESAIYNVGIGAPSQSAKIDEKLVVSSSSDTRVKIESATGATSASLYLESGQGVWELAVTSESAAEENMFEESLVFRTRNSKAIHSAWSANGTYAESLRLNNLGKAGFSIPYDTATYELNQQVTVSGSLNIIQGRTIDINSGTFHNSDNTNGIYFNNQKMIYVSGSGAATSIFLGVAAGGVATATDGHANIGFGYQSGMSLTSGHRNILIGDNAGKAVNTGDANVFIGEAAGLKATTAENCIAIGTGALYNTVAGAQSNIAIGHQAIKTGVATGDHNTAIGTLALEDLTTGADNVAIGSSAALNLTTATDSIAIGHDAMSGGATTGNTNIGIGKTTLNSLIAGTGNIALGRSAGKAMVDNEHNIAIGHHALYTSAGTADKNIAIGYNTMKGALVTGADNIGVGQLALDALLGGANNIALGKQAAEELTTGSDNIAIGLTAMGAGITTGDSNIGIGSNALDDLTSGTDNVAIGSNASDGTTTAADTIAIGHDAMSGAITTGNNNIAIGKLALKLAVGASNNIGIGYRALRDTSDTAARNIAIGDQVAFDGVLTGLDNIIMGTETAAAATSLAQNVIIGHKAVLTGVMTGDNNTVLGPEAAQIITSGADNVIIGHNAGSKTLTTNTNNILIGSRPSASAGIDNAYAIGNQALVTQADSLILGGQTGKQFRIGIGGITAPNATLEVSGTLNITGSAQFSGSATNGAGHGGHTLRTIGTTVMTGTLNNEHFRPMRALEVSGTANFHGNTYITGNLIVSDIVIAQEFHTEFVSASITFTSGSHKMGDTNDDVHQMTGSLRISGSGEHYIMGRFASSGVSNGTFGDGAAKFGINTMSPEYEFQVHGNTGLGSGSNDANYTNAPAFIYNNSDEDTYFQFQNNRLGLSAGDHQLHITGSEAANNSLIVNAAGGDFNVRVLGGAHAGTNNVVSESYLLYVSGAAAIEENGTNQRGAIGIRTSNPTKALTVSGSISASNDLFVNGNATFGTATVIISGSGDISASNHIWASSSYSYISSSYLYSSNEIVTSGFISASGNIQATGIVSASLVSASAALFNNITATGSADSSTNRGTGSFGRIDVERIFIKRHEEIGGQGLIVTGLATTLGTSGQHDQPVQIYGNITASNAWFKTDGDYYGGHISASTMTLTSQFNTLGNISGSSISASTSIFSSNNIEAGSHITASGNISSSGTVLANFIRIPHTTNDAAGASLYFGAGPDDTNGFIYDVAADSAMTIGYNTVDTVRVTANGIDIAGNINASGHITASGNISSSATLIVNEANIIGNLTASGNISASFTSTGSFGRLLSHTIGGLSPILLEEDTKVEGHITASGNISSSGAVISNKLFVGDGSFSYNTLDDSTRAAAGLYIVTQSLTGTAESASMVVLHNEATSDLFAQRSFIEFKFTDGNANVTPQVKIGAEVGNGDGNAGDLVQEGMGAFVVYTTSASSATVGHNTEKFRVSHEGNVGIGTSNPIQALEVKGNVTASGDINAVGNIRSSGSIASTNYRSFYIAAAGMTPGLSNGASTGTEERPGNASADNSYPTIDYLAFDASTAENAQFQIPMPGEWNLGTLKMRFYYMTDTADGGSNNDIMWGVHAQAISGNESMNNVFSNGVIITSTAHNDAEKLVISDATGAIMVQGTLEVRDLINFKISRNAGDAADTYTGDAHLLGVSIQYQERVIPEAAW